MIELALAWWLNAAESPLERCRAESQALNTAKTIARCGAASEDTTLPVPARVEAYRLLGVALVVEGEPDLAEAAFGKMLALDPQATLGDDAGPNVQKVLARAAAKIHPTMAAPPPPPPPPLAPSPTAAAPTSSIGETVTGFGLVGVGGLVAVAAGTVGSAAAYDRFFHLVPCPGSSGHQCVPAVPMLFGLYDAGAGRARFINDAGAWIGVGVAGVVLGAVGVGVGVLTVVAAPDAPVLLQPASDALTH